MADSDNSLEKSDAVPVALPPAIPAGPSERLYRWVDVANKIFQIAAIFIAGLWGGILFEETSAPELEPKLSVDTEVSWQPIGGTDVCQANFVVTVKNPGRRPIEITTANLGIRVHNLLKIDPKTGKPFFFPDLQEIPTLIDAGKLDAIDPPPGISRSDVELLNDDIVGRYPPGLENSSSQVFFFKKFENALAMIQVNVDGFSRGVLPFSKKEVHNYGYVIARVCGTTSGEPEVEKAVRKKTSPAKTK
jgi:hypothetical protein